MSQTIETRKISNLLGAYRNRVENLKTRNEGLFEAIQHPEKIPPCILEAERKSYNVEYNSNTEKIIALEGIIEDLEDIIIGDN